MRTVSEGGLTTTILRISTIGIDWVHHQLSISSPAFSAAAHRRPDDGSAKGIVPTRPVYPSTARRREEIPRTIDLTSRSMNKRVQRKVERMKILHPGFSIEYYDDVRGRQFLLDVFGSGHVETFD